MLRVIIPGLTIILAIGGPISKTYAQDPSARCVSVENKQMTIASAGGRGLDIEDFTEAETATFVRAFNAAPPTSAFVATAMFAAVGPDRVYVFFESGKDLCTAPSPLPLKIYEALVQEARGNGA
jgi:hypothetical protein